MREIKFRAWDKENKDMWEWGGISEGDLHLKIENKSWMQSLANFLNQNYELMQYTGLKDKNGREIYEGDILAIYPCDKKHYGERAIYQVTTDETSWGYAFDWEHIAGYECSTHIMRENPINYEVIGNIYENPELLK